MTYQGYLCFGFNVALFESARVEPILLYHAGREMLRNPPPPFYSTNKWSNFDLKGCKSQMQMAQLGGLQGNQMGKMLENLG